MRTKSRRTREQVVTNQAAQAADEAALAKMLEEQRAVYDAAQAEQERQAAEARSLYVRSVEALEAQAAALRELVKVVTSVGVALTSGVKVRAPDSEPPRKPLSEAAADLARVIVKRNGAGVEAKVEPPKVKLADVQRAIVNLAKAKSSARATELLSKFGAEASSDLREADYAAVIRAAEEASR